MQELQLPLEIPYHSLVVLILNSIFGSSPASVSFWENDVVRLLHSDFNFDLQSNASKISSMGKGVVDWYKGLVETEGEVEKGGDAAKKDKKKRASFYKKGTTNADIIPQSAKRKTAAPVLSGSASARDAIVRNPSIGIGSSRGPGQVTKSSGSDVDLSNESRSVSETLRNCTIQASEPGISQFASR